MDSATLPPPRVDDTLRARIRQRWFGNDIFISYSRRDGGDYALSLANELTKAGITCFLDQWGTPPGTTLPNPLKAAIKASTMFVLIGTPGAAASENVRLEVEEFLATGRAFIPISFVQAHDGDDQEERSGALETASWYPLIHGISLTRENGTALQQGQPSPQVVSRVVNAEGFTRRNLRLRRVFIGTLVAIAAMLLAGGAALWVMLDRIEAARQLQVAAEASATRARASQTEAERAERSATASRLATLARSAVDSFPQRAAILASQSAQLLHDAKDPVLPAVEEALRESLANIGGVTIGSHAETISKVAFSADSHWIATAGYDGKITVWDRTAADFPAKPRVFATSDEALFGLSFSPDGRSLIAFGREASAWLLNLSEAQPRTVELKTMEVADAGFTPDSRSVVLVDKSGPVRLFRTPVQAQNEPVFIGGESPEKALARMQREAKKLEAEGKAENLSLDDVFRKLGAVFVETAHTSDFRWAVTSGEGKEPQLFDLTAPNPALPVVKLQGHSAEVARIAVSTNGEWLATLGAERQDDRIIRLWRLKPTVSAKPFELSGHTGRISSFGISPDDRWLVTGSEDQTGRVWDLSKEDPSAEPIVLKGHAGEIWSIAFSPNSRWLATGSDNKNELGSDSIGKYMAQLWELKPIERPQWMSTKPGPAAEGIPIATANTGGRVTKLMFSGDGEWLVADRDAPVDNTMISVNAHLWRLNNTTPRLDRFFSINPSGYTLRGHERRIEDEAFSPDSRYLATASADHTVRVWNLDAHRFIAAPLQVVADAPLNTLLESPDGRWLVFSGNKGRARFIDLTNPERAVRMLGSPDAEPTRVAMSRDGRWVVVASGNRDQPPDVVLYHLSADAAAAPLSLAGTTHALEDVIFSGDSRLLIGRTSNRRVQVWRVDSAAATPTSLDPATTVVDQMIVSANGKWLATTAAIDKSVRLWSLTAGAGFESILLEGHTDRVVAMAFSPDNRWIATTAADQAVRLWDLKAPAPSKSTRVVADLKFVPNVVRFSPNGRWLLSFSRKVLSYHAEMALTDMNTAEGQVKTHVLETWQGQGGFEARAALISPDSRWLLTSIYEGSTQLTTMLWDLAAPDPSKTRKVIGGVASLAHAAFSPDSRRFSTGDQIWDLGTPEPTVVRIPVIGRDVNPKVESVAFSRDGHWLIVGADNKLSLHTLRIEELIAMARASASREMTDQERHDYLSTKTDPAKRP